MYLQHPVQPPKFRLRYFSPDSSVTKGTRLNHEEKTNDNQPQNADSEEKTKSFLDSNEKTFAEIRQRLSTLTLNTDYKGQDKSIIHPPFQRDKSRRPPKRISSIGSHDTADRIYENHTRIQSRASIQSDNREYRPSRRGHPLPLHRAGETAALHKLNENILTPGQNPELFSRQIKMSGERPDRYYANSIISRSSSPKSVRSVDSSGKVHLGLIESLDLNEKLNDVEKIKERYSKDSFIHSLAMYKLRGHDKCLRQTGMSEHIPRGTKLNPIDDSRQGSRLLSDSMYSIPNAVSPRLEDKTKPLFVRSSKWEPDKSYFRNHIEVQSRNSASGNKFQTKIKKSVGFAAEHEELNEEELQDRSLPPSSRDSPVKEPKSILKRTGSQSTNRDSVNMENNQDDEFIVDENYHWKYKLPKIRSPVQSLRARPPMSFRKKMYHFGDGVSEEFDQVISKYGNCRQSSWVREHSYVREKN
ncbi:hypothetical protein ACF0H5_001342 [Mactra antiquata]